MYGNQNPSIGHAMQLELARLEWLLSALAELTQGIPVSPCYKKIGFANDAYFWKCTATLSAIMKFFGISLHVLFNFPSLCWKKYVSQTWALLL